MRIDAQSPTFWSAQRSAKADSPQFTNMTRRELREWMNHQITSGAMDLDESTPFVFMTLDLPVSRDPAVAAAARERLLDERVNFVDAAERLAEASWSRHEEDNARLFESAIAIMRRYSATPLPS